MERAVGSQVLTVANTQDKKSAGNRRYKNPRGSSFTKDQPEHPEPPQADQGGRAAGWFCPKAFKKTLLVSKLSA